MDSGKYDAQFYTDCEEFHIELIIVILPIYIFLLKCINVTTINKCSRLASFYDGLWSDRIKVGPNKYLQ